MPDLTAAELSIPAEQHPDPAKPLVIPVDSTVVGSTRRFIPWSAVGNPALLNLPPPPPCTEEAGGEPLDGTRRSDVHACSRENSGGLAAAESDERMPDEH